MVTLIIFVNNNNNNNNNKKMDHQWNVRQFRHILASPGYAPETIAVNVIWMKRGFNACQTHRSMYPSVFNRFPLIQPVSSKVHHFSTFFAHFGIPGYAPVTIAVNVTWIEREFNACQMHRSMYTSSTVYEL